MTKRAAYLLGGRPIHFPFVSGTLRYKCEGCDAPCCRGESLGIGRSRELVTLRAALPSVDLFATPGFAGSATLSIAPPMEACWFLDKNARCRLDKIAGKNAKPAGCRLFPFQTIRSMGTALCVLPDFSCPIGVFDKDDDCDSSHDELTLVMHRAGVPRGGHPYLIEPADMPWESALALERAVVEASSNHMKIGQYLVFAAEQQQLTSTHLGIEHRGGLSRLYDTIARVLGAEDKVLSKAGTRELVAVTGTLRVMASSIARSEMPALLLAHSVLLGVYENMRGRRRTVRSAVSLFENSLPFLYVLSHLKNRAIIRDGNAAMHIARSTPAVRAPLMNILEQLTDNKDRNVAVTLEEILRDHGEVFSPPMNADAVIMLHGLGRILMATGLFVPV